MKISKIYCDNKSFRTISLNKDNLFNILLAEKTAKSKNKDSRNGLGKSTLIQIIDFCLGGNLGYSLKKEEITGLTFGIDLEIDDKKYSFSRNTSNPGSIVLTGDFASWPIKPEPSGADGLYTLKIKDFNLALGNIVFNLPIDLALGYKYYPSFRSLISYFIRSSLESFIEPFKHFSHQKSSDIQINNGYLLGLEWQYPAELQLIKDDEKTLNDLKKAANSGLLENYFGSLGELDAERVRMEEIVANAEKQMENFVVHPQYYGIQKEADILTEEVHSVLNDINLSEQILKKYKEDSENETSSSLEEEQIKKLYSEVGKVFSDELKKKLEDVAQFHKNIVANRKEYLKTEIDRLEKKIGEAKNTIEKLSKKKSDLLTVLKTHGALDEYSKIQGRLSSMNQKLAEIKQRIGNLKKFNEGISDLRIRREELLKKMRHDFDERKIFNDNAIRIFNSNSEFLYEEPGLLSIEPVDSGYKFSVEIKRAGSQGIGNMKIFCYDLMLAQLWAETFNKKLILIHDSTIFDGVDGRQVARALELAEEKSNKYGFQYFCTMNSDVVPATEFSERFRERFDSLLCAKLTDANETGCLLGRRF